MKILCVFILFFLSISTFDVHGSILDNLQNVNVDCGKCESTVKKIHNTLLNKLPKVSESIQNVLCKGEFMEKFPKFQERCKKDITTILTSLKETLTFYDKSSYICKNVVTCGKKINTKDLKVKLIQVGISAIAKVMQYDQNFASRLSSLAVDTDLGSRQMVETFCKDATAQNKETKEYMKNIFKLCNFEGGTGKCSICDIFSRNVMGIIKNYEAPIKNFFLNTCPSIISSDVCQSLADKFLSGILKTLDMAVQNNYICGKTSLCPKEGMFSKYCHDLKGKGKLLCELSSIYESAKQHKILEQILNSTMTEKKAYEYCSNKLDNLSAFIESKKENIKSFGSKLCQMLSGETGDACKYLFTVRFEPLIKKMKDFLESHSLCNLAIESVNESQKLRYDSFGCTLCDTSLKILFQKLNYPENEAKIRLILTNFLKTNVGTFISEIVDSYYHRGYVYLIKKINAKEWCAKIRVCPS